MIQKPSYEQIKDDITEWGPQVIYVLLKLIGGLLLLASPFVLIAFFIWAIFFDGILNTLLIIWPKQ